MSEAASAAREREPLGRAGAALGALGEALLASLADVGDTVLLVLRSARDAVYPPLVLRDLAQQLLQVGARSLRLTITMALFAGMVLAFQFGYGLERFGAKLYIGQTTVTALVRELGPILTALVVGARVGSGIAAELGGMAVTEQIDAVRALGASPLRRLVAPRILATTIAMPLLAVVTDVVGFFGGMAIAKVQYGVSARLYTRGAFDFVLISDVVGGIVKTTVFGFLVGAIACHAGMRTTGGTEGVGRATTRAVVASALVVLAADFLLTKLLLDF